MSESASRVGGGGGRGGGDQGTFISDLGDFYIKEQPLF